MYSSRWRCKSCVRRTMLSKFTIRTTTNKLSLNIKRLAKYINNITSYESEHNVILSTKMTMKKFFFIFSSNVYIEFCLDYVQQYSIWCFFISYENTFCDIKFFAYTYQFSTINKIFFLLFKKKISSSMHSFWKSKIEIRVHSFDESFVLIYLIVIFQNFKRRFIVR